MCINCTLQSRSSVYVITCMCRQLWSKEASQTSQSECAGASVQSSPAPNFPANNVQPTEKTHFQVSCRSQPVESAIVLTRGVCRSPDMRKQVSSGQ